MEASTSSASTEPGLVVDGGTVVEVVRAVVVVRVVDVAAGVVGGAWLVAVTVAGLVTRSGPVLAGLVVSPCSIVAGELVDSVAASSFPSSSPAPVAAPTIPTPRTAAAPYAVQ